ncbi:hypothetical protein K5549_013337 [Capra hircus]|nr:hypothetical protein K5549_013337 [Capra hircus]
MLLRDDYRTECDQDVEALIRWLSINSHSNQAEAHALDMHMQKLKELQQRKTITRDYNLVPTFLGKDKNEKEEVAKHKVTKG